MARFYVKQLFYILQNLNRFLFFVNLIHNFVQQPLNLDSLDSFQKLILAVHKIIENHSKKCFYFPSYEILMDELRDYRFYSSDWIHPNEEAVNYIWDKFADTFFDKLTKEVLTEVGKLRKALNHKPMFEVNLSFYEKLKNDIQKIKQKTRHKFADFE